MAESPEYSDYTSIQQRINSLNKKDTQRTENKKKTVGTKTKTETSSAKKIHLMPLTKKDNNPNAIGFTIRDYLE